MIRIKVQTLRLADYAFRKGYLRLYHFLKRIILGWGFICIEQYGVPLRLHIVTYRVAEDMAEEALRLAAYSVHPQIRQEADDLFLAIHYAMEEVGHPYTSEHIPFADV